MTRNGGPGKNDGNGGSGAPADRPLGHDSHGANKDRRASNGGTGAHGGGDVVPLRRPKPCPTCGKPSTREAYPFCSTRCADVDLNRWLSGQYVVPGRPLEDGDGEEG